MTCSSTSDGIAVGADAVQDQRDAGQDLRLVGPPVERQHRRRVANVVAHREVVQREIEMADSATAAAAEG